MSSPLHTPSSSKVEAVNAAIEYLIEGIDIYNVERNGSVSNKKKTLWMENKLLRICIEDKKTDRTAILKGMVPNGICLRDISELRLGTNAFNFKHLDPTKKEEDCCFSIIGTERTLCMITPTKYSRDQFLRCLNLVINHNLTEVEKLFRERSKLMRYDMEGVRAVQTTIAAFRKIISVDRHGAEGGVHVLHHNSQGKIVPSKFWFSPNDRLFHLVPEATSMFSMSKQEMQLHIDDVAEVRPGTHSLGFLRTQSVTHITTCLSIVASEDTLDLEFPTTDARNIFTLKLRQLIQTERTSGMDSIYDRSMSASSALTHSNSGPMDTP